MRSSKLLGVIAMAAMVATPVLAAAPVAPVNPALALSLPAAGNVRASSKGGKHNDAFIAAFGLLGIVGAAAVVTVVAVAATGGFSSDSN